MENHFKEGLSCREIASRNPSVSQQTVSRKLVRDVCLGKVKNADSASRELHPENIHRVLRHAGMKAIEKMKKLQLRQRHGKLRLYFAKKHAKWTVEHFKNIL